MPKYLFTFDVSETRLREVQYVVEADTEEEAIEKAERGEAIREIDTGIVGILGREINQILTKSENPRPWSVADTEVIHTEADGTERYETVARFGTLKEAEGWIAALTDIEKVERGAYEISGPEEEN